MGDFRNNILEDLFFGESLVLHEIQTEDLMAVNFPKNVGMIVVLAQSEQNEANLNFLSKIAGSVGFDLSKTVGLLAIPDEMKAFRWNIKKLARIHAIQKILVFGIAPSTLGLNINHLKYRVLIFNTLEVIFSDSLSHLNSNTALKSNLWGCLQLMFSEIKQRSAEK